MSFISIQEFFTLPTLWYSFRLPCLFLWAKSRCFYKGIKKGANPFIINLLIFDRGVWNTFGTNKCKEFTPYAWTSAILFSFLKMFSRRFYQENKSVSSIYVFYVYILRHNYRFQIRCKDTTFIWINQRLFWNCSFQLIGAVATVEGERAKVFRVLLYCGYGWQRM